MWCVVSAGATDSAQRDRARGQPFKLTTSTGKVITVEEVKFDIFVCGKYAKRGEDGSAERDTEGNVVIEDFYAGRVDASRPKLSPLAWRSHVPFPEPEDDVFTWPQVELTATRRGTRTGISASTSRQT